MGSTGSSKISHLSHCLQIHGNFHDVVIIRNSFCCYRMMERPGLWTTTKSTSYKASTLTFIHYHCTRILPKKSYFLLIRNSGKRNKRKSNSSLSEWNEISVNVFLVHRWSLGKSHVTCGGAAFSVAFFIQCHYNDVQALIFLCLALCYFY